MDHYAVIGHPVQHSQSPVIHQAFAKQTRQNISYIKIEAPLDGFRATVKSFTADGGKGCNVTMPFKMQAYQLANDHSESANEAEAANTLQFFADGRIYAHNTDGLGLVADLMNNHHFFLREKNILIIGAGGAVRSIIGSLLNQKPACITIVNRTAQKAQDIAAHFAAKGKIMGIGFAEMEDLPFDLIIQATSIGSGHELTLSEKIINPQTWCYDLMYGAQGTPFLHWAKKFQPACCLDGLGMLVEQAAAAFYLWRGVYPATQPVIDMLRGRQ